MFHFVGLQTLLVVKLSTTTDRVTHNMKSRQYVLLLSHVKCCGTAADSGSERSLIRIPVLAARRTVVLLPVDVCSTYSWMYVAWHGAVL